MSYILDALRRADRERRRRGRTRAAAHSPAPQRRGAMHPLVLAAIAVLLVINGVALGVWVLHGSPWSSAGSVPSADRAAPDQPPPAVMPRGESLLAEAARERPPPEWPEPWEVDPESQADSAPETADSPPPAPDPAPDEAPPEPAPAEPETPPRAQEAPLLEQLPDELRRDIGAIELAVHVYARNPAARFVMVDGERMGAGDTRESGLELVAVLPGGALFRFREQDFRVVVR